MKSIFFFHRIAILLSLSLIINLADALDVSTYQPIEDASLNLTGEQDHATIAATDTGVAFIAWHADAESTDAGLHPIFGRLYDIHSGTFSSLPFLLDYTTDEEQWVPDVETDLSNAYFIIAWSSNVISTGYNSYFRIIDYDGYPVIPATFDERLQVNKFTSDKRIYPDVDVYDNGDFVIAWDEVRDGEMNYFVRVIKPSTHSMGQICKINSLPVAQPPSHSYGIPDVSVNQSGGAAVVWENVGTDSVSISLTLINPYNCKVHGEIDVDPSDGIQRRPVIDINDSGVAIVGWTEIEGTTLGEENALPSRVFIKKLYYSTDGISSSNRIEVTQDPPGKQRLPVVLLRPEGASVVSWATDDLFLRIFNKNLIPLTDPLLINGEATDFSQTRPAFSLVDGPSLYDDPLIPLSWESTDETGRIFIQTKVLSISGVSQ